MAGFPSPAEQYLEMPLDLNELLIKRPANGDIIIASVDGDFTVKTLRLSEEGNGNREEGENENNYI